MLFLMRRGVWDSVYLDQPLEWLSFILDSELDVMEREKAEHEKSMSKLRSK